MKFLLTAPLLLAALGVNVLADKDTDFYYSGFTNPNVKKKMYWKDAYNVLEDLDQFSALYITYHNCAHSLYPTPNGSDEDEDNEGYDFWYSYGAIPKFRANAAYSLYGILKSDGGSSSSDACHKGTYINSFFTNRGVETLTYPFGIGNGETSQCGAEMNGNGDEDGGRFLSGDGGDGGSYGLGCYDGQFVYGQYSAGDCMGYIESVSDTMDDLNAALESLECIQIYDENGMGDDAYVEDAYGDDAYGDDAYNDDGGRMLSGDGNGDYYQAYEDSEKLDILLYSEACRIDLYGSTCPDPYGQKQGYESALNRALKNRPTVESGRGKMAIEIASAVLFLLGAVLFGSAFAIRKRAGARTIQDTDDALMTPEKMEKTTKFG